MEPFHQNINTLTTPPHTYTHLLIVIYITNNNTLCGSNGDLTTHHFTYTRIISEQICTTNFAQMTCTQQFAHIK